MEIATINCASCGAPLKIPSDIEAFNCSYCGASLVVKRGEGYVALKLAEQVSKSVQEVGVQTQSTIREGTQVTQVELKRLQLSQEISSLQLQLSNVKAEIRMLQRQKANRSIKRQLKELNDEEVSLINRIKTLQAALVESMPAKTTPTVQSVAAVPKAPVLKTGKASPLLGGCLWGFILLFAVALLCSIPAQALDQALFDIPMDSSGSANQGLGPLGTVVALIAVPVFCIGFAYGVAPKAKIWKSIGDWVRGKLHMPKKPGETQTASSQVEPEAADLGKE